jgi:MFS family permease
VGEEAIGSFLALGGLGGLMAGPVAGYLTDRLGRRATALIGILATLATLSLYLTPLWFTHLALILPLLGFTLTSAFTPLNTLAVEVAPKARATATSIYGSASFLGFTLAPIIAYPFYTWATIQGVAALAMAFIAAGIVVLAAIPPSEG